MPVAVDSTPESALAEALVAGDETKVAHFMVEDYLHTDVNGNIPDSFRQ